MNNLHQRYLYYIIALTLPFLYGKYTGTFKKQTKNCLKMRFCYKRSFAEAKLNFGVNVHDHVISEASIL